MCNMLIATSGRFNVHLYVTISSFHSIKTTLVFFLVLKCWKTHFFRIVVRNLNILPQEIHNFDNYNMKTLIHCCWFFFPSKFACRWKFACSKFASKMLKMCQVSGFHRKISLVINKVSSSLEFKQPQQKHAFIVFKVARGALMKFHGKHYQ